MDNNGIKRIAVVGGGAWGTAVANHCARLGHITKIWARERDVVAGINKSHRNDAFLPGVELDAGLSATGSLADALAGVQLVLVAVPVQHIAEVLSGAVVERGAVVVNLSKGVESPDFRLPLAVIKDSIGGGHPLAVLSGPSFAAEVALGTPTVLVAAARRKRTVSLIQNALSGKNIRIYRSSDTVGVQLSGALKNIYAIASGMISGMKLGENTRAALIVRALAEMIRFGKRMARAKTFSGAAGVGDLILTCTSDKSRNFSFGEAVGQGGNPQDVIRRSKQVVEGYYTAEAVHLYVKSIVEMPIAETVYRILYSGLSPNDGLANLMNRSLKDEWWG